MQVKSIALSPFIKLPFVIKVFVLSIFEWPFYTGFTVQSNLENASPETASLMIAPFQTLTNSADPDEMQHLVGSALHQGMHCLLE